MNYYKTQYVSISKLSKITFLKDQIKGSKIVLSGNMGFTDAKPKILYEKHTKQQNKMEIGFSNMF